MSRVVLYRCTSCGSVSTADSWDCCPSRIYGAEEYVEPIEYLPASVARGLVEALKNESFPMRTMSPPPNDYVIVKIPKAQFDAALADAEEAMK